MYQIYFGFYVILSLCQGGSTNPYKEGDNVPVQCDPTFTETLVFWFRINRDSPEFLITTKNNVIKTNAKNGKITFSQHNKMFVQSFNKVEDSGVYFCAAMNNNRLIFGQVSEIKGEQDPTTQPPKITPAPTKTKSNVVPTTPKQCSCKKQEAPSVLNCETWILSSLASGCGFLLVLLVITILYCNRLRTRRCPHHYKRQPRNRPAGHAKLPNNHF